MVGEGEWVGGFYSREEEKEEEEGREGLAKCMAVDRESSHHASLSR